MTKTQFDSLGEWIRVSLAWTKNFNQYHFTGNKKFQAKAITLHNQLIDIERNLGINKDGRKYEQSTTESTNQDN